MNAPAGEWATPGIKPVRPPRLFERTLSAVLSAIQHLNVHFARLGNPGVYANTAFPWVMEIEAQWRLIRDELDRVLAHRAALPKIQDITADAASITQDAGWKIFLFVAYGIRSNPAIALCPQTWRILQRIPGLKTAMFSVFESGKHLPPHRGPYNGVLRLHLGLVVPQPAEDVAIRVDNAKYHWEEGSVLIFDDSHEHEAWNHTSESRVVLFVDFVRPLSFPVNVLNHAILSLARLTPYLRDGERSLREWEACFFAQR